MVVGSKLSKTWLGGTTGQRSRVILSNSIAGEGTGGMKVLFRQGQKIRSLVFGTTPISGTMEPINWLFGSNWSHHWSTHRYPIPKVKRGFGFFTFSGRAFAELLQELPLGCNIGGNEPTFATTPWPLDLRQNLFQTDSIPITFFLAPTTPLNQDID